MCYWCRSEDWVVNSVEEKVIFFRCESVIGVEMKTGIVNFTEEKVAFL